MHQQPLLNQDCGGVLSFCPETLDADSLSGPAENVRGGVVSFFLYKTKNIVSFPFQIQPHLPQHPKPSLQQ